MTGETRHSSARELSFVVLFSGAAPSSIEASGGAANQVHPIRYAAEQFADGVKARTNGDLTVKIYPTNTLYSQKETLEKNVRGIVDLSVVTQGALDKYVKAFALVMLPFTFDNYEHADRVLDGPLNAWLAPLLEQQKLVLLANWEWGFRNITNNVRPIHTPDDVNGLKLRIPPGEQDLRVMFEACGASVGELELKEVYNALQHGRFDGEENPIEVIYRFKLYEVQKYLALTRHAYNCMMHVMGVRTWEKLSPEFQQVLQEESRKAGAFFRKIVREEETRLIEELRTRGMIVTTPDAARFRAVMKPAYQRLADYVGAEDVTRFMQIVDRQRR